MTTALSSYRDQFPITEKYAFLSHAAVSPLNLRVDAALRAHNELMLHEPPTVVFPKIFATMLALREKLATLVNARRPDEIVFMPNTATGVNTAALSLPLQAGDNILVLDGDYPANVYPWQQLAYKGVFTKMVPQVNGGLDLDALTRRIDRRTRVIALSTAMFATGFRNNIDAVGQICKERGIFFVVDAIQTLGAFPLDVQASNIDFLACGSQKWLLSAPGAGFLYCRHELHELLQPGAYVGAASSVSGMNYLDYNLTLPESADRFNLGTPNIMGILALDASVSLIQEVGVEQIAHQINLLVDALIDDLSERGFELCADIAPEHRSGIVVARIADPAAVCKSLEQAGVIATPRGNGVRFAPHFYNTLDEVLRASAALDEGRKISP